MTLLFDLMDEYKDALHTEEEIDHKIEEWIQRTTQKDITFQEAYIELPIEYKTNIPKRINYLNLIWLKEKMYKEAIEETRKNVLREYPEQSQSPEDILNNMEDIYYRERDRKNPIQEDKDKYSNPPL